MTYELLVITFGLCNAPLTFTILMNTISLEEMEDFVIVYINDILVYSMELIHKASCNNVVPNALSRWEKFVEMSTTQTLWLIYKGERNLQCKLKEGYINDLETQRLLGEISKSKALKEVKLEIKHKKNRVYVPQGYWF